MTWPNVTVNQVNQLLGETNEVERTLLFIGTGTKNVGKTLAVNAQSDFDALLGEGESPLKKRCSGGTGKRRSELVGIYACAARRC